MCAAVYGKYLLTLEVVYCLHFQRYVVQQDTSVNIYPRTQRNLSEDLIFSSTTVATCSLPTGLLSKCFPDEVYT